MDTLDRIESYFEESGESFTIYVCEQRFAVGRGHDFFRKYQGTDNIVSTNTTIKKLIKRIIAWTESNVPNVAELIKKCFFAEAVTSPANILDIISALSKLFSLHQHQAVGPKVIDPIIIQEGGVSPRYLAQLVSLHKESILQPAIIIILKDNDFDRAKQMLSKCPHGINVKMIRNSGKCEIYKIINCGADSVNEFLDSYALQCFSTCSRTPRTILNGADWENNPILYKYSPLIFKIRSNLLFDEKEEVRDDIAFLLTDLEHSHSEESNRDVLITSFLCMTKLFSVFCNDKGGKELDDALKLANSLENPLLVAHTYRYANLMTNISNDEREKMLGEARRIFSQYNVEDHAIYCENNALVNQFYTNYIDIRRFQAMQQEAINNVPGMVGMSHILNNTGVAHLYAGRPEDAIEYFNKGLDYARDRIVQKVALKANIIVAKAYCLEKIDEREMRITLNYIFDNLGIHKLPFLSANYVMNILAVAAMQDVDLVSSFAEDYPIIQVLQNALSPNQLGSGSLVQQLGVLCKRYSVFADLGFNDLNMPIEVTPIGGIRANFIENRGVNPSFFNVWL